MKYRLIGFVGIFVILGIAWLFSNNKKKINYKTVAWGLALQLIFALIILKTVPGQAVFFFAREFIEKLLSFTDAGAYFLFGNLYLATPDITNSHDIAKQIGDSTGPMQFYDAGSKGFVNIGLIFAIHILPTIIFFASVMAVLYHLGFMQKIVQVMAWIMSKFMKTSGAESLSAASNIFVGQTEAPLVIKPYIDKMTRSEIMAIMTGGFATIAGGVMAAYVRFGVDAGHLMAASVMSAPAALVMAKIIFPETEKSFTAGDIKISVEKNTANIVDAAASGAATGLRLAVNVGAMLLAFLALVAMINFGLGLIGGLFGYPNLELQTIFGILFYPLSFFMGVEWSDLLHFGNLLGTKISINELVAYIELTTLKETISERSYIIATYALCGFANFSAIAIQIGGISSIAPKRRQDLAKLGIKAMFAGALASWLTATIAGILL